MNRKKLLRRATHAATLHMRWRLRRAVINYLNSSNVSRTVFRIGQNPVLQAMQEKEQTLWPGTVKTSDTQSSSD